MIPIVFSTVSPLITTTAVPIFPNPGGSNGNIVTSRVSVPSTIPVIPAVTNPNNPGAPIDPVAPPVPPPGSDSKPASDSKPVSDSKPASDSVTKPSSETDQKPSTIVPLNPAGDGTNGRPNVPIASNVPSVSNVVASRVETPIPTANPNPDASNPLPGSTSPAGESVPSKDTANAGNIVS